MILKCYGDKHDHHYYMILVNNVEIKQKSEGNAKNQREINLKSRNHNRNQEITLEISYQKEIM